MCLASHEIPRDENVKPNRKTKHKPNGFNIIETFRVPLQTQMDGDADVPNRWETSPNNDALVRKLDEHFREEFQSRRPEYYVKVPGRVNLIGEHVDYCGYSVFPMAIDQCIVVAAKRTVGSRTVHLTNLSTERYKNVSIGDLSDIR